MKDCHLRPENFRDNRRYIVYVAWISNSVLLLCWVSKLEMTKIFFLINFIIYNSITDNLVCVSNMRRIDYLLIPQRGLSVVCFPENQIGFSISYRNKSTKRTAGKLFCVIEKSQNIKFSRFLIQQRSLD